MYSGIISMAQNHRLERVRFAHSFLMPVRCSVENGAWDAMKIMSSTTTAGQSSTIFNATVLFIFIISACRTRKSVIGLRTPAPEPERWSVPEIDLQVSGAASQDAILRFPPVQGSR